MCKGVKHRFENILNNKISNIDFAIANIISNLLENNYVFHYESPYHNKFNIKYETEDFFKKTDDDSCPICYECIKMDEIVITKCNHNICLKCLNKQLTYTKPYMCIKCCLCRDELKNIVILKSL